MYVCRFQKKNDNFLKSKFVTKTETLKVAFNHKKDKRNIRGNIIIFYWKHLDTAALHLHRLTLKL